MLLTRPPLTFLRFLRRFRELGPFDLHVLSTPPAFVLSQDQTLHQIYDQMPMHLIFCFESLTLFLFNS